MIAGGCQKAITISRDTRYLGNLLQTLWKKKAKGLSIFFFLNTKEIVSQSPPMFPPEDIDSHVYTRQCCLSHTVTTGGD